MIANALFVIDELCLRFFNIGGRRGCNHLKSWGYEFSSYPAKSRAELEDELFANQRSGGADRLPDELRHLHLR